MPVHYELICLRQLGKNNFVSFLLKVNAVNRSGGADTIPLGTNSLGAAVS